MSSIRHYLSVASFFTKLSLQRQLEYPLFLISWILVIPINYFSGIWVLKVIVDRFQPLNGWDFPELTFIYGLAILSHGIFVMFFITVWHIDSAVINGGFDRLLLRPMNVFFQQVASYFNLIGCIDLIPGIIIFSYGCYLVDFDWTLIHILKLALVIIGGVLIRAGLYISLGSLAFWTKRTSSLVILASSVMERTSMYPLNIYPYVFQMLFTFIIPIGFITYYPSVELLHMESGFQIPLGLAIWTPIVGLIFFFLSQLIFRFGMTKYESAGS